MTSNRKFFLALSVALLLPILAGTLLAAGRSDDDNDSFFKYLTVFTEVLTRVRENYVEPPNVESLLIGALDGTADALDPFSMYVPKEGIETATAARQVGTDRSGLLVLKEHGLFYVAGVEPGSPADKAGLKLGDYLTTLDQTSTRELSLWQVQAALARAPGSKVELKVLRFGEQHTKSFELADFARAEPKLDSERGVSVLKLNGFDAGTAAAVERILADLSKAGSNKLVIDLRGVSVGDPRAAYAVAGLFTSGEIGRLKRRDEDLETFKGRQAPLWSGKVAVLTSRGTLGAAEILAAVLKQKAAAQLVGDRTFGYAGRLAVAELASGGQLIYTDAFFGGPDGKVIRESLLPDVRVFDTSDGLEEDAPQKDEVLAKAVSLLLGEAAAAEKKAA